MKRFAGAALRLVVVVVAVSALLGMTASSASARPKSKPQVAFVDGSRELRVVGADGRGERTIARTLLPPASTDFDVIGEDPSWSPDGKRVAYARRVGFVAVGVESELRVARADGSGDAVLWSVPGASIQGVRWSPDGHHLAFVAKVTNPAAPLVWSDIGSRWDIYLINADGSGLRPLAPVHPSSAQNLDFSPNGKKIAFISDQEGLSGVFTVGVDGPELPHRVSPPHLIAEDPRWSPDGKKIAFTGTPFESPDDLFDVSRRRLWTVDADGSNARRLPSRAWHPASWSPDGGRLVYTADRGIKVVRADGGAQRTLYSGEAYWPVWSGEGQIAFIREGGGGCCTRNLWVMNGDGSHKRQISDASAVEFGITWSK